MKRICLLVLLATLALTQTGCTDNWIKVAEADLPVLAQMALNIGTLYTTVESGQQLSQADVQAIQNISTQAQKDLTLLSALYQDYQGNPNAGTLAEIQATIADVNQNLPQLLEAAHVSNVTLSARVTAAVNLILVTVNSFATLIPQQQQQAGQGQKAAIRTIQVPKAKVSVPKPDDLKKAWNLQVAPQFATSCGVGCQIGSAIGNTKFGG